MHISLWRRSLRRINTTGKMTQTQPHAMTAMIIASAQRRQARKLAQNFTAEKKTNCVRMAMFHAMKPCAQRRTAKTSVHSFTAKMMTMKHGATSTMIIAFALKQWVKIFAQNSTAKTMKKKSAKKKSTVTMVMILAQKLCAQMHTAQTIVQSYTAGQTLQTSMTVQRQTVKTFATRYMAKKTMEERQLFKINMTAIKGAFTRMVKTIAQLYMVQKTMKRRRSLAPTSMIIACAQRQQVRKLAQNITAKRKSLAMAMKIIACAQKQWVKKSVQSGTAKKTKESEDQFNSSELFLQIVDRSSVIIFSENDLKVPWDRLLIKL